MTHQFDESPVKLEASELRAGLWTEELDRVPLKQRLKLLLANQRRLEDSSTTDAGVIVKKEDESQCVMQEEETKRMSCEESQADVTAECGHQGIEANKCVGPNQMIADISASDEVDAPHQHLLSSNNAPIMKLDYIANSLVSSYDNSSNGSGDTDVAAAKIMTERPDDTLDDLDHVVLIERQKMLLAIERQKMLLASKISGWASNVEEAGSLSSSFSDDIIPESVGFGRGEVDSRNVEFPLPGTCAIGATMNSGSSRILVTGLSCATTRNLAPGQDLQECKPVDSGDSVGVLENNWRNFSKLESNDLEDLESHNIKTVLDTATSTFINVKVEPSDKNESEGTGRRLMNAFSNMFPVKTELEIPDDACGDELDHMLLRERMQLFSSRGGSHLHSSENLECSKKLITPISDYVPIATESVRPLKIKRPRKRRKTATESIETALEEDAPGLLQVLVEKGVSVNEIKLYGEPESNESLDDSSADNFTELVAVISRLFSQPHSSLKLPPIRCTKMEKRSYCLACLFSLVEQARYLQFRKWPAEWGWCRDLQSFIFVFERHKRIVLERPEYGYATYFFELVDSLPIDWQIKRLVTAMKLTSCSRATLLENKALMVGEELTEGEARVLMDYGWTPNSGLGTMLNYRDRVVHDRKNEKDSSEWRSKIGKLLMDGYNGGTIVSTEIPSKVIEYGFGRSPQIKLELN